MRVKLCEKCKAVEIVSKVNNKKYCDNCRVIANREKSEKHANKYGMGIYKITNLVNNKVYIGQSIQLNKRIVEHKRELKNNVHYNEYLQRSYNKYGSNSFTYEIIENCSEDELYERENYWIEFYNSHSSNSGYNNTLPPKDEKKYRHTEESKVKLSNSKKVFENEELISYLQEYYYHFGKVPTSREISKANGYPNDRIYYERFGSLKNALIEADLFDFKKDKSGFNRNEYSKEEVFNKFKIFIDKNGRFPNHKELKRARENDLPTSNIIVKLYGSTENLRKEFGFDKETLLKMDNQKMLEELMLLYQTDGYVTSRTIDKSDITRSSTLYCTRFGTMENAYNLAGIPYDKDNKKTISITQ